MVEWVVYFGSGLGVFVSGDGLGITETRHRYLRVHSRHDVLQTLNPFLYFEYFVSSWFR